VPRQMIIPAFAAKNSEKLAGYDWTPLFGANNPNGTLPGAKLTAASVTTAQLADSAVTTAKIADGQITAAKLAATPVIGTGQLVDGGVTLAKLAAAVAERLVPAGSVNAYAGTNATPPVGWLYCNGSPVSRTAYAALFAAIGTAHGSGDGATTFNLPDYRWTFLRGYGPNITVLGTGAATGDQATFTNHGFIRSGVKVRLAIGMLQGLSANTDYWVIVVDANTLAFASSKANAVAATPVKVTLSGVNTAVIAQWEDPDAATRIANTTGANSGGALGSSQPDAFKSHTHTWDLGGIRIATVGFAGGANSPPYERISGAQAIGNTGGWETRPVNSYVHYLIKY